MIFTEVSIIDLVLDSANIIKNTFKMEEESETENVVKVENLRVDKKLQNGEHSSVEVCTDIKTNKTYVFKKYLNYDRCIEENRLHSSVSNEFISEYVECNYPITKGILTKYYPNGDLFNYYMHNFTLDFSKKFYQIALGLKFLKSLNILHRDIKPENIFLDENLNIKIGDFGFAIKLENNSVTVTKICGTILYAAPEIVGNYSYPVDVWSLGVLIFSLACGTHPFRECHLDPDIVYDYASQLIFRPFFNKQCEYLIRSMLDPNPETRITIEEVCNHKYFERYH